MPCTLFMYPGRFSFGGVSLLSPIEKELAVLVELRDARSVVSVSDEHGAVGKPRQKRRPIEMRSVGAGHS